MQLLDTAELFAKLPEKESLEDYNLEHFRTKHLLQDGKRTVMNRGIQPGDVTPDFSLAEAGGGSVRLSDFRGKPVVLHFGSIS
jgi:hypothetical protein